MNGIVGRSYRTITIWYSIGQSEGGYRGKVGPMPIFPIRCLALLSSACIGPTGPNI
jgi:hypothetical protein